MLFSPQFVFIYESKLVLFSPEFGNNQNNREEENKGKRLVKLNRNN